MNAMNYPLQITYRDTEECSLIEERIRKEAAKLGRLFDRISSCRVVVETPHRHHRNGRHHQIRIVIGVRKGSDLVINHEPSLYGSNRRMGLNHATKEQEIQRERKGLQRAIESAFADARRRLRHYAQARRKEIKLHNRVPAHRSEKLSHN